MERTKSATQATAPVDSLLSV